MPLYEYECQQCHRHTEKRQKFSDPEITECPHCGGPLERVLSAPAFSFAGGGWYKDLYSSAKPSGNSKEGGDTSGSSSEAKPAAGAAPAAASAPSTAPAAPAASPAAAPSTSKP